MSFSFFHPTGRVRRAMLSGVLFVGATCAANASTAWAQTNTGFIGPNQFYQPLHQNLPTGTAAYWAGAMGKATPPYFQPVRVDLPTGGEITVYHGGPQHPITLNSQQPIAFLVGHTYRLRIGGMREYPGIELYPSVEVLDRLHPPPGKELDYPIPLQFTEEEIEAALGGQLVTKVIFLEQPQLAPPRDQEFPIPTAEHPASVNVLAEADLVGRPVAILRLGSRAPWAGGADAGFFGAGAPVYVPPPMPAPNPASETTPNETRPAPQSAP